MWSEERWQALITTPLLLPFTTPFPKTMLTKRTVNMEKDNLLGVAVRIRRGWHGGRTGKVIIFEQHPSPTYSYEIIKVQLDGSGQVVRINNNDELERLDELPHASAIQQLELAI
jgi:hypothetical protein